MTTAARFLAIGLMSGTSLDGIDAALIETDGQGFVRSIGALTQFYQADFRKSLRRAISGDIDAEPLTERLTDLHAEAVEALLEREQRSPEDIRIVGFHGQTISHRPHEGHTLQIGDGERLAKRLKIDVAYDFRSADVAAGGQGAPLAPIFHAALAATVPERPLAIVNIGGVANVTWIGGEDQLIACDVGPGNGPIDDWINERTGQPFDAGGRHARAGHVDEARLQEVLSTPFFRQSPPKSLDRLDFTSKFVDGLSLEDGAATLTELTAAAIADSAHIFPSPPARWLISGGGRSNEYLMERLAARAGASVATVEAIGINGDNIEAEAFAYLAVRRLQDAPISFPATTGVPNPMPGGRIAAYSAASILSSTSSSSG